MTNYKIGDYYDLKTNNKTIVNKRELNGYEDQYFHQEEIKMQVFHKYEDGGMLLILEKPTTQELTLSGEIGFKNGIEAINKLCQDLLENPNARNLTHEDIIKSEYWKDETKRDLIFGKNEEFKYWLGSPFVYTNTGYAYFGLHNVSSGYVLYNYLYYSNGITYAPYYGVRPVVYVASENEGV